MRKLLVLITFIVILGCQDNRKVKDGNNTCFFDALEQALLIAHIEINDVCFFYKFENQLDKDSLKNFYYYGSNIYGYEVSDSIINYIDDRKNKVLSNNIKKCEKANLEIINDTIGFQGDYVMISEPIYVEENRLLFSIRNKRSLHSYHERWIFFLEHKLEGFKVSSFYNFQKDKLYLEGEL